MRKQKCKFATWFLHAAAAAAAVFDDNEIIIIIVSYKIHYHAFMND